MSDGAAAQQAAPHGSPVLALGAADLLLLALLAVALLYTLPRALYRLLARPPPANGLKLD